MFQWIKLKPQKIYIIPTRVGIYFILATLVVLLVGSGYSNNLINLLAFFMLSFVFVAMVLTNLQLSDLKVISLNVESGFAGDMLRCQATIQNSAQEEKWGIRISDESSNTGTALKSTLLRGRIRSAQSSRVNWTRTTTGRGKYTIAEIGLDSIYPLGLFYTWKKELVTSQYFVYPEIAGDLPLRVKNRGGEISTEQSLTDAASGDEFKEHRAYVRGDSGHHVDWKAHARGHPLLVKEMNAGHGDYVTLSLSDPVLRGLSTEQRLSQLCVWVRLCASNLIPFQLLIPGFESAFGEGWPHAQICLEHLALFQEPS